MLSLQAVLHDKPLTNQIKTMQDDGIERGRVLKEVLSFLHNLREGDKAYARDYGPVCEEKHSDEPGSEVHSLARGLRKKCEQGERCLAFDMATHIRLGQDSVCAALQPEIVFAILSSVREAAYKNLLHAMERGSRKRKRRVHISTKHRKELKSTSLNHDLRAMNEADCSLAA